MNGKPRSQSGLSLMEILIALVVIGIGVGVFLKMQKGSGSNLAGNSKMMRAGQLVEKHVEAMRIRIARDTIANWPPKDTSYTRKRSQAAAQDQRGPIAQNRRCAAQRAQGGNHHFLG